MKRPDKKSAAGAQVAAGTNGSQSTQGTFERQLFHAFLRHGLHASMSPFEGGYIFLCPECADEEIPEMLSISDNAAKCRGKECYWESTGTADKIAKDAKATAKARVAEQSESVTAEEEEREANPFPLHCLPPSIAAMAQAIADSKRTPTSLPGCCVLVALSASIGAGLRVQSAPDRFTRANIFSLLSAESGSGKSECFGVSFAPFFEFEKERVEHWKESVWPGVSAEKDVIEAEIKKLKHVAGGSLDAAARAEVKSQLEQKKLQLSKVDLFAYPPTYSVDDVTTERLAVLFANNGETLASLSADAGAIVSNLLGRYSKLDRTDEGIYLKAYSGDYCRIDRQSREPVILHNPCLSALWLVQPDKVETLLAERSLTDGGLVPRILICHTHAAPQPITSDPVGIPPIIHLAYRTTLRGLLATYHLRKDPLVISPNDAAIRVFTEHFNGITVRQRSDLRDVATFAARWTEQAWRLAVCIHAGTHGSAAHERQLDAHTATLAIELANWFAARQLEILESGRSIARRDLYDSVLALLDKKPDGIKAADVYRARITKNASSAAALLQEMVAAGDLRDHQKPMPEHGGHSPRIYTKASATKP